MDDTQNDGRAEEEQSFASMLQQHEARAAGVRLEVGDRVRGPVVAVDDRHVFVDTGTKADAVVDRQELEDDQGRLTCQVGDELELFVVQADEGEIRLSRAAGAGASVQMLRQAMETGLPVEGKVKAAVKGGFAVQVAGRRAFCPISQIDAAYVEDPAPYVGQVFSFQVTAVTEGGRNIVLSRRKLLEAEQEQARKQILERLAPGQVVDGTVTRLMPYGAFVSLGPGLEGLVHISELSWSRLASCDQAVAVGDRVSAKVLEIGHDDKGRVRISLSVKQATEDPWQTVDQRFEAGMRTVGQVTRVVDFGAFVQLAPGIEGLVHVSQLSHRRVSRPADVVAPGQQVAVVIKAVDTAARRISLSMKDAEDDPWLDAAQRFAVGRQVEATVESRQKFGLFVRLAPGITGLLPASMISEAADADRYRRLRPGQQIRLTVADIDTARRRITLTPDEPGKHDEPWQQSSSTNSSGGLGTLGERLRQAMETKQKKQDTTS